MNLANRIVFAFFFSAFIITTIVLSKLIASIYVTAGFNDQAYLGRDFTESTFVGLICAVVLLFYTLNGTRAQRFVNEAAQELVQVTWPTFDESKRNTFYTIMVTIILAILLFGFDKSFGYLTDQLLLLGRGAG
ncbi:MAG: preprotein translocase subunit SecE [Myxococcota bacterium]|nr:preprotein translocase subunit SecE [Myxococcota bacterium]